MACLGATLYDPATAVAKSTAALLAMTALDTANLRLTFAVPSNGRVLVQMAGVITGATTFPQVLLGVMNGTAVVARVPATAGQIAGTALATTFLCVSSTFVVSGLTPGASLTWDAAYSVDVIVASTAIRYGGPNDATTTNAYGGFSFSVWDA